ncbi:ABC transporter substrate-binding protein [Methanomethylophilus alvi]|uniref:ABC transporter substrate-binding protein n=1 Tax=Methanomethylophilus alvi TaxID=1291540 RepID=UPI0037DDAC9C
MRNSEVNSVVLYNAEDEKSIIDNIFITGVAMNYGMRALDVIESMTYAMNAIRSAVSGGAGTSVMVTLNTDASPTVAGSYTYVSDMLSSLNGNNVASEMNGWAHLTSEYVTKYNPSYIVILDSGTYSSGDYGRMLANLSPEWKNTDAYKNGNIYLLCEDIGELSQRASPRSVQFFEILARILNPDSFPGGIVVPKTIGNDYVSYLTYTKDLGFGD